jgi:hypothetical protein
VPLAPRLADLDVLVVGVPDRSDRRRHSARTILISPEGRRRVARPALLGHELDRRDPAARPSWAPRPGSSSTLWTTVPIGMFASGSALPTAMSAPGPDSTVIRRAGAAGARM